MPLLETQPDALCEVYAKSIHDLALSKGGNDNVATVAGELRELLALARDNRRFGEFLSSRIIGVEKKQASLATILRGKASPLTLNFIMVLAANERLAHLPGISAALDEIVETGAGRVEVKVTTASPINPAELESLKARIQSRLTNQQPVLKTYTDPAMIGGIRLQIGDKLYDASVETKLRQLREQLSVNGLPAVRAAMSKIVET